MKQPLAPVVGLFALGILIGRFWVPPLVPLFIGVFVSGAVVLLIARWSRAAFWVLLILSGWTHIACRTAVLSPDDLRTVVLREESLASVRGVLVERPQRRFHERSGRWFTNTIVVVDCSFIRLDHSHWRRATGLLAVSTSAPIDPRFRRGVEVVVSGVLRRPSGPLAPGLFDYAQYLRWRGIHFELRVPTAADWEEASDAKQPRMAYTDRFEAWARRTLSLGLPVEDTELHLLWAMTLGWKTGLTDAVEEPFMRSGTMHIFAISGLHIALVAAIATQVLRLFQVPRIVIGAIVLPAVWFYTIATGSQASAVRASLMTSVVVGGWMLARPLNVLNSLSAAGFAVLLWDPRQLFHAGFQLSFGVVAALGTLLPIFEGWRMRLGAVDPFLPPELVPWWRQCLGRIWWAASGSMALSLSSWIGSLPLTAWHFHLLTPCSLLANLIVVPLSSLALASNMASLCTGFWAPGVSELFNHSAWFWMRAMLRISTWAADLPGACWHVRQPPLSAVVLWYLGLAVMGLGWWKVRGCRVPLAVLAGVLATDAACRWHSESAQSRLVVLPFRGGHAVWIEHASRCLLVDCGDADAVRSITTPFLHARGVNRLESLVLTHGDVRHVGGAVELANEFRLREVVISPVRFRSPVYRRVTDELRQRRDCRIIWLSEDEEATHREMKVRHPSARDSVQRADDGCMVLELRIGEMRVLLLSDLAPEGQQRLMQRHPGLRADIVIGGSPERGEPMGDGLLRQLSPKCVVVADATHPATARASRELKARLHRNGAGARVFFTSETGGIELRGAGGDWTVRDARGRVLSEIPRE